VGDAGASNLAMSQPHYANVSYADIVALAQTLLPQVHAGCESAKLRSVVATGNYNATNL